MKISASKKEREIVFNFKKFYIQVNIFNMLGLGLAISNKLFELIILFLYIGIIKNK